MIDRYGTSENIVGELTRGKLVTQIFVAKDSFLSDISIDFGTYMRINTCNVFIELTRNGNIIHSCKIRSNIIQDNKFHKIPINVELSIGSIYEIRIYSDGSFGNAVTVKYGKPLASTCIYQIVSGKVVNVPGCDCYANIINCNNPEKEKNCELTTRDCKRELCRFFTTYETANVNGLWMRINGQLCRGQICCLFHYGFYSNEENESKISSYDAVKNDNEKFDLSIVIPTALRIDYLKRCLDSIRANTKCKYEVNVIINTDSEIIKNSVIKLLHLYKNHSFHVLPNLSGYVSTCNLGAKNSRGNYICIMNDDIIVGKNWFENMVCVFEKDKNIAQVGPGKLAYIDKTFSQSLVPTLESYIEGWCFIIPRWIYDKFGLFDTKIEFAYCEDSDFSVNLRHNGYKIVVTDSNVKHLKTKTSHLNKELKEFTFRCEQRNKKYLIRKWFS